MPSSKTLEPVVRVLRTLLAVLIAVASVAPWLIATVESQVTLPAGLVAILAQVVIVCVAVTAFFATTSGNRLLKFIGLNATTVDKVTGEVKTDATKVETAVGVAVDAEKVAAQVAAQVKNAGA